MCRRLAAAGGAMHGWASHSQPKSAAPPLSPAAAAKSSNLLRLIRVESSLARSTVESAPYHVKNVHVHVHVDLKNTYYKSAKNVISRRVR